MHLHRVPILTRSQRYRSTPPRRRSADDVLARRSQVYISAAQLCEGRGRRGAAFGTQSQWGCSADISFPRPSDGSISVVLRGADRAPESPWR
jgi:hypothetical protein